MTNNGTGAVKTPQGLEADTVEPHYELTSPLSDQGGNLHFYVGAWNDRGKTDGTFYSSARADAMDTIDAMLSQLQQLRSALIREGIEYQEQLLAPKSLGECSREGCERPAIEAKPGYVGPLYCSPVHAFIDRANREGGA